MRFRLAPLLVLLLIVTACAPAPEPEPEPAADAEPVAAADTAALDAIRVAYMEHYNLGDADMVAELFTDDAVSLLADGGVRLGREAIQADLTQALAGAPTLGIETDDTMVMGDHAVTRGQYTVEMAPEGSDPVAFGGQFISSFRRVDGEWKIRALMGNYDAPPAAGLPSVGPPEEAMEELTDSPTAALTASYVEHFNLGHPEVVAGMYAADAVAAFANQGVAVGNVAIESALTERIAMGSPQLTIHQVGYEDFGDGWALNGGWYEITATTDAGEVHQIGNWLTLVGTDEDGTQKIQWAITNTMNSDM